ncbi:MAG: DinB family protein [Pseudomonadota bacterium]
MTPAQTRQFADYNAWQNARILRAAEHLSDAERWKDRGAFFGSIARTLNHIMWDDAVWLARIEDDQEEAERINARFPYADDPRDWAEYRRARDAMDARLISWAAEVSEATLAETRPWHPGGRRVETPIAVMAAQIFNHQTHHRGQVHAMLTAAGVETEATDLMMMWLETH